MVGLRRVARPGPGGVEDGKGAPHPAAFALQVVVTGVINAVLNIPKCEEGAVLREAVRFGAL